MKIAMFTNNYAPLVGGIERSVAWFARDFRSRGHPTSVVTVEMPDADDEGDDVFRVPALQGPEVPLRLPSAPGLQDHLDAFAPSLIHSHQPFLLGDTALREAAGRRLPLVFTYHTLYERYADSLGMLPNAAAEAAKALPAAYADLCDHVIAPTQSIAELIRDRGVTAPITVLPTGIETARFAGGDRQAARRRWGVPAEAPVVGHLGRLLPAKNLDYLGEAIAAGLRAEPRAWALWVGEGESVDALEATMQGAGVADRCVFTGVLTGDKVADAYAAMDLFAFSSHTDTQGLVLAEALAAGVPVLALRAPGARDVLTPETSVLLPPETPAPDFAKALTGLLGDPNRLRDLAAAGPQRAAEFDRDTCTTRMLALYERVTSGFRRERGDTVDALERLQERLQAEWSLLREKADAAQAALGGLFAEAE